MPLTEMFMESKSLKIVYITPALYMAGGVERVLTLKANYFVDHFGYDITIILTDGKDKPLFYPLSDKIEIINLDINYEELWHCSFLRKVLLYLHKQRIFKRQLSDKLMQIKPDITVSLLRREINFINSLKDGSKKIGELHVNKANYRNFEANETNFLKRMFQKIWMRSLVGHLKSLDKFVVLTCEDRAAWSEVENVMVIPDPLSFNPHTVSPLLSKRVIAVGRYCYQKGFDLLLNAWARVEENIQDWELVVYGTGDRKPYEELSLKLKLKNCSLRGSTKDIEKEYLNSSLFVFSSRFEGFGMVLVEAMACGLPVVSSNCPCGPKDIIDDGIDGLLFENGNPKELAEKLMDVMSNSFHRKSLAQKGVKKARHYEIQIIAEKWKDLFEELVSQPKAKIK